MIRIIVAGSRTFTNYLMLQERMDFYLRDVTEEVEIVSGAARGADHLGERYAHERGYRLKQFHANWDLYDKRAGPLRNEEMAQYATHAVVFWDGQSRGTASMIELAEAYGLKIRVVRY